MALPLKESAPPLKGHPFAATIGPVSTLAPPLPPSYPREHNPIVSSAFVQCDAQIQNIDMNDASSKGIATPSAPPGRVYCPHLLPTMLPLRLPHVRPKAEEQRCLVRCPASLPNSTASPNPSNETNSHLCGRALPLLLRALLSLHQLLLGKLQRRDADGKYVGVLAVGAHHVLPIPVQ